MRSYVTSITAPQNGLGKHATGIIHPTWIAVTPHTQEQHLPAKFLMDSVFNGVRGESLGSKERGFTALSPT